MLPTHAPPEYADRNLLWNSVEWNETKANAQLARSIELSLPAELSHEQNIELLRKYVQENFVDKGMCADIAFHDKNDGNPHVHILLTILDYQLLEQKEEVRRLEVVKREFIRENKQKRLDLYGR